MRFKGIKTQNRYCDTFVFGIMRLDRLGWTQQEIADKIGAKSHAEVNKKLSEIPELEKLTKSSLSSGLSHDDIAQRFNQASRVLPLLKLGAKLAPSFLPRPPDQGFYRFWQVCQIR